MVKPIIKKGREEGRREGRKEGRKEGRQAGRQAGGRKRSKAEQCNPPHTKKVEGKK